MSSKDTFGSLFGKAKQWAKEELKNATRVGGDPNEHRRAREAQQERTEDLQRDVERATGDAVVEALLPQGVKDWRTRVEEDRVRAETERSARERAARAERAGTASARLSGWLDAELDGLAANVTLDDERNLVAVVVEPVDPVPVGPTTFNGFSFQIVGYHGDGTYTTVDDDDFDAFEYQIWVDEASSEGFFHHPMYGTGRIVVADGVADVDLPFADSGSREVRLRAQVALGPI